MLGNTMVKEKDVLALCVSTSELGIPVVPSIRVKCIECKDELWMDRNHQLIRPMPQPICQNCFNKLRDILHHAA